MKSIFRSSYSMIKNYRWSSIFFKYWKKLMIFFMIPFIIVSSFINIYYNKYANMELDASLVSSYEKTKSTFNKVFDELDKYYMFFSSDEYVKTYTKFSKESMHVYQNHNFFYQTNRLMRVCLNTSSYLNSIYLYNTKSGYVTATQFSSDIDSFFDKVWFEEFKKNGNPNIVISHYEPHTKVNIISFCYGIYGEYNNIDGIIVFNIDSERLSNLLRSEYEYSTEDICLADPSGTMIFSTSINKIGSTIPDNSLINGDKATKLTKSKDIITLSSALGSRNLSLIVFNKLTTYVHKKVTSNAVFFIILLLLSLIAPLVISLYLSSNFYSSIAEIAARLQQENGMKNDTSDFDELKYINQNIMNIISNKQNIEKELVEKVSALKKSQSLALQAQLNPHFLFNTLNAISIIYSNLVPERNDAELLTRNLSDILYFSLNTKEYIINVTDEILYVKKYIEIESIKYENSFDVEWFIDEEVNTLKTVKFVLQPIVENAFEHGLKSQAPRRKKLSIIAQTNMKELLFIIKDNGSGMPPEKLSEINKNLNSNKLPEDKHIGICNVNMRIQLAFGNTYGIHIDSSESGTIVSISMPIIK